MSTESSERKLSKIHEAAEAWGVTDQTIRAWIRSGVIPKEAVHRFGSRTIRIDVELAQSKANER